MTATEVMHEIRALDPQGRAEVLDFLLKLVADQKDTAENDAEFEEATRDVFARHTELMRKLAQ